MMMYPFSIVFLFAVIPGVCLFGPKSNTPCSRFFQLHVRKNHLKFGLVTIPKSQLKKTLDLVVVYAVSSRIPQIHRAKLELSLPRPETIELVKKFLPIQYIITFPRHSPPPKVTTIIHNNWLLCSSPVPPIPAKSIVTEIRLHHKLYTGLVTETISHSSEPLAEQFQSIPQSNKSVNIDCGQAHLRYQKFPAIEGGLSIQKGSWPWLVAVYTVKEIGISFNCGANLISPHAIVGAAHCFQASEQEKLRPNEVLLSLGRHDVTNWAEPGAELREVAHIFIHPDYRKVIGSISVDADVAVAVLSSLVKFGEFIRPICLGRSDKYLTASGIADDTAGVVVGWGSDGNEQLVTQTPRSISIPIVSEAECLRSSSTYRAITSNRTFCAGRKDGYGPCHGDSGSGMAILIQDRWTLRGIVSAALAGPANTCDLSNYVVFTDINKFHHWIMSFM